MTKITLSEIVDEIKKGIIKDGDTFESEAGLRVVYKDGVLSWVTSGGYVGSPVTVTEETANECFTQILEYSETPITFLEALPLIEKGTLVKIVVDGEDEYEVRSFEDIDYIIENDEFFGDLYNAEVFIKKEAKATTNRLLSTPIVTADMSLSNDWQDVVFELINKVKAEQAEKEGRKISESDAYYIHHLYHFAKYPVEEIAKKYGISTRMVYYILDGTHWADVHKQFHNDYDVANDDYID